VTSDETMMRARVASRVNKPSPCFASASQPP
jgi:hypothetical protein